MGLTLTSGGGSGGASPEQVRAIMADTLVPGAGITIDPAGDQLQVASTVGVTTAIRTWEPAALLYATPFDAGVPAWVAAAITTGTGAVAAPTVQAMTVSLGDSKPAFGSLLVAPTSYAVGVTNTQTTTLALQSIPQVAGKAVTRIRFWVSLNKAVGGTFSGSVLTDGTSRLTIPNLATNGTGSAWQQFDYAGTVQNVALVAARANTTAPTAHSGLMVTGLEVYGNALSWMLNDVAAYQGNLWRSMQDNNPHTPGSGQGWQQI